MKRSTFIRHTSIAALTPLVLGAIARCNPTKVKRKGGKPVVVLIQLNGGNDGLNTLIPLDNYERLVAARPELHIPENKILSLRRTFAVGLHPVLKSFQDMYNNGLMGFIQGVGYENPNYSHFRSSDVWLTGSKSNEVLYTGWMARYLETRFKNYPEGFPNDKFPHPPAVTIGDTGSYLFQGENMDMSIVIDPTTAFEAVKLEADNEILTGYAADEVKSIRKIMQQTERYAGEIKKALAVTMQHSSLYPKAGENSLADQLKVVAKLIHGGLDTSVYLVDLKGFDTHDFQAERDNTSKGLHADLLFKLQQAVGCFWDDITRIGRDDDVLGMTFSEFGRRIMANASNGTDHGTAQPIIYFGKQVNNAVIGANPVLPAKATPYDNLELLYDYRAVFSSVLQQWLGAEPAIVKSVLPGNFPDIEIVNG